MCCVLCFGGIGFFCVSSPSLTRSSHPSFRCQADAKALHYKEIEFRTQSDAGSIEALIEINNRLQLADSSLGIFLYAQQKMGAPDGAELCLRLCCVYVCVCLCFVFVCVCV